MCTCSTSTSSSARFKFVGNYNIKSMEGIKSGSEIFYLFSSFKEICHLVC